MSLAFITEILTNKWIIFYLILSLIIYHTTLQNWNYFSKQNVKFVRGIPIFGAHYRAIFCYETMQESFLYLYNKFPNEKIIGFYEFFGRTGYLLRDVDLIKQVTIKHFDYFVNRSVTVHKDVDTLMGRALFTMEGQEWKDMRSTMSPAFTGSKMRLMFGLLLDVATNFTNHLKKETAGKPVKYELKCLLEHLASDTIASCAFGLSVNSLEDTNNEFYRTGQSLLNRFGKRSLWLSLFPKLMKLFKIKIFDDGQTNFFRNITKDSMDYRKKHNIKRNDMIDVLIEAENGILKHTTNDSLDDTGFATVAESSIGRERVKSTIHWTNSDMAAQSMTFFLAGFFGMVFHPSFVLHHLAVNPEIKEKLYQECKAIAEKLEGKPITYEYLQKMKYLDMVLSEVLRRWSFATVMDRSVTKPYVIENSDGSKIKLNIGDTVWIPIVGLHMDPIFFPNPTKFDPERFSDENRTKEMQNAFVPFGIGPRNCIGSRFAIMEAKVILYLMVLNFNITKCDLTQDPLKLKKMNANVDAENGFWLNIQSRS